MTRRQLHLAKTTRPRLRGVLQRRRLYALLDRKRASPIVWIAAHAGAGKTTLVAGYLEARELGGIWYQMDAGDADPATFFHYLGEAARQRGAKQRPLPPLTPEYLFDLPGFARRFLRDLFAMLGPGATLVLDNFQDAAADQAWHTALAEAFTQVADGANLIVLSRSEPPAAYSRLRANRQIVLLDWETLRLTAAETRGIVLLQGARSDADIKALHLRSNGWPAGLTLLLECLRRGNSVEELDQLDNLQEVFDYFATEVFEGARASEQEILLAIACLPRVTADVAVALARDPRAGQLLESFHRRHLFTDRRRQDLQQPPGGATRDALYVYQFHALFRDFLRYRAEQAFSAKRRRALARRGAALLQQRGHIDEAVALYLEAQDWQGASKLMLSNAAALYRQGRWETLLEWLDALPDAACGEPWLVYWRGVCRGVMHPSAGRELIEKSIELLAARQDRRGQLLCLAEVVRSHYFESFDLVQMHRALQRMNALGLGQVRFDCAADEVSVLSAAIIAQHYTFATRPATEAVAQRIMHLLQTANLGPAHKLEAAIFTLWHCNITGQFDLSAKLTRMGDALLAAPEVSDLMRSNWHCPRAWWLAFSDHDAAQQSYDQAIGIAVENNFPQAEYFGRHVCVYFHAMWGEVREAQAMFERMQQLMQRAGAALPLGGFHDGTAHLCAVFIEKAKGEQARALFHAELAWKAIRATPSAYFIAVWGAILADVFTADGQYERARIDRTSARGQARHMLRLLGRKFAAAGSFCGVS